MKTINLHKQDALDVSCAMHNIDCEWAREEYLRHTTLQSIISDAFKVDKGIVTLTVASTTYDSPRANCYDSHEVIASFVSVEEAKLALKEYFEELEVDQSGCISTDYDYGHKIYVDYHSEKEVNDKVLQTAIQLQKLLKLKGGIL